MRLNERAESLVQAFLGQREVHGIRVHDDGVNVPVVDCGVNAPGGIEAGLAMARIAAAGLAEFDLQPGQVQIWAGPHVAVRTDQPVAACLAAQYAGWKVQYENYFAMASGPMRAAYGDEAIYDRIGFRESPSLAVGLLESAELPPPFLCQSLADRCEVEHRRLTLLVAKTSSLAGTIQVVARSLETALHKLYEVGFDLQTLVSGWGIAPLPPVAGDDLTAVGRTNDAILYGARVTLWADADDDAIQSVIDKVPSCASSAHGKKFAAIFEEHDRDFYKIDPQLFSPAWVRIHNLRSGRSFSAGRVEPGILLESFA